MSEVAGTVGVVLGIVFFGVLIPVGSVHGTYRGGRFFKRKIQEKRRGY